MWKWIVLGVVGLGLVFALLLKAGDKASMGGEQHSGDLSHGADKPAASQVASSPAPASASAVAAQVAPASGVEAAASGVASAAAPAVAASGASAAVSK